MSTSADLVQIAIVAETVYGVTPANPAFVVVRTTGEGIAFAPTTTVSNEMNPLRQVTDSILTGGSVTGALNFEMAHEAWFDSLLAGAFCSDWATNALKIGTTLKSFTIEKMIPVPGGITQYHRYAGCTVNGFSFDVKPNAAITGSFDMLGKGVTIDTNPLAGASYSNPYLNPVMTAPRVVGIQIGGIPAVSQCFNNLQIAMNNNNRAIECIGTLGAKELALGRCEITATFGVLFNDSSLLQTLLSQTETSLQFQTSDTLTVGSPAAMNYFIWTVPRVKFTADPVVAGGTGQDVVNDVTAQGLLDSNSNTAFAVTRSALVHNVPMTPTILSPLSATGSQGTAFTYQITGSGSPTSYNATGLPAGLSINTSTGVISGTPTAQATTSVTITATNAVGSGTATLVITVAAVGVAPVISSPTTAAATVGTAFSYQIAGTNTPTQFNATGLPAGLSVNTATGAITGTPTVAGVTAISISATNATGTGTGTVTLTVSAVQSFDTQPKFGTGAANAYTNLGALLASMTDVTGGTNHGRSGTFNLTTTAGNFGWVAVESAQVGAGMHFFDGVGYGGWSGAGLAGNNSGNSDDPTVSSVTYTDGNGTLWKFFRQDYVNANPSPGGYTLS